MSKSILGFLSGASVEEVKTPRKGGGGRAKQWNPIATLLAIRVFKDGSVFPSQAAVDQFDLEYRKAIITQEPVKKGADPLADAVAKAGDAAEMVTKVKMKNVYEFPEGTGNGFDVIDSRIWAGYKAEGNMLFIAAVKKDAGKVDLFQTTNYEADGTPKSAVMDQGSMTFGRTTLIPAIEALYGITFHKPGSPAVEANEAEGIEAADAVVEVPGVEFVDMVIVESIGDVNIPEKFKAPFTLVPKRVNRGEDKGKPDYERREGLSIYGFIPASVLGLANDADNVAKEDTEETDTQA